MQIIKNTRSLIVVLTIAALALLIVAYAPKSSANDWWSQVEQCVKEKETAKSNSDDSYLAPWMYNEWEEECGNAIPYTGGLTVEDVELEIELTNMRTQLQGIQPVLRVISLNDHVEITGLQINRGNCDHFLKLPVTLNYGGRSATRLTCKIDRVREVVVSTTVGDVTYSFSR